MAKKKHKRLHPNLKKSICCKDFDEQKYIDNPDIKCNISSRNATRLKVVKNLKEDKIYKNQKVVCNNNYYNYKVYNSSFYYVKDVINNKYVALSHTLDGNVIKHNDKPCLIRIKDVESASCVTVYRYQGKTINEQCRILNIDNMDYNELYTALSRNTKLSNLQFKYTNKYFRPARESNDATNIKMSAMNKGYIYVMKNKKHKKCYVGQTDDYNRRIKEHRENKDDPIKTYDGEWTDEIVTTINFIDKTKLNMLERYYIEFYDNKSDYDLINAKKKRKKQKEKANVVNIGLDSDALSKMFEIKECDGYFTIRQTIAKGKRIRKKMRFNSTNKETVKNKMIKMRKKLIATHA